MSDRICVASKGSEVVEVSAEDLLACCGASCGMGCNGGFPEGAWKFWHSEGIVSGGLYDSHQGCKPYSIAPCEHHAKGDRPPCNGISETPKCVRKCISDVNIDYYADKHVGTSVEPAREICLLQSKSSADD